MTEPTDRNASTTIPEAHAAAIGRIANAWAVLEFEIDLAIWDLSGTFQMLAACMTAQLMSIHPRLKALHALIEAQNLGTRLSKEVATFAGDISSLVEKRNRAVHDPRMTVAADGSVERLEVTAQKILSFGFQPEPLERLSKTEETIKARIARFRVIKGKIRKALIERPAEQTPQFRKIIQVPLDREDPTS
ncbi:MAG: hypothetical protein ACRETL_07135 [Gammaproteobacteria bacterium]